MRGHVRRLAPGLVCAASLLWGGAALAADPCAGHVPQPKPQNASRDIVGQDIDAIASRPVTGPVFRLLTRGGRLRR